MRGCFWTASLTLQFSKVFPAHAGVFLKISKRIAAEGGLPRACGGVSKLELVKLAKRASSPRMRGCFFKSADGEESPGVFPAHAGVFPKGRQSLSSCSDCMSGSSPRMRGCFRLLFPSGFATEVFPAHAGVFLTMFIQFAVASGLPRACGGVSAVRLSVALDAESRPGLPRACGGVSKPDRQTKTSAGSSPRMRGCFQYPRHSARESEWTGS